MLAPQRLYMQTGLALPEETAFPHAGRVLSSTEPTHLHALDLCCHYAKHLYCPIHRTMPPVALPQLVAGVVVGCIVFVLLFSTLLFCYVQFYQPTQNARIPPSVRTEPKRTLCQDESPLHPDLACHSQYQRPADGPTNNARPLQGETSPSSYTYLFRTQHSRDIAIPSPDTPDWLRRPLSIPPTVRIADASVAASAAFVQCKHTTDCSIQPSQPCLPMCYTPSTCPTPCWRDSVPPLVKKHLEPHRPLLTRCYSPSIYSATSWRDSSITLFEEDIQPIRLGIQPTGLGIGRDVEEQAGYSGASVHTARTSTIIRVDSNKSTAGLLEIGTDL